MRAAPRSTASENKARSVSGLARVLSSVTKVTGRSAWRAASIALFERESKNSKSQSSATARIGLEPMNSEASIAIPARCDTSAIAATSEAMVRPAHTGRIA